MLVVTFYRAISDKRQRLSKTFLIHIELVT